jgi:hypothetical protein
MTSEHYPCEVAAVYPDGRTAAAAVDALNASTLDDIRVIELTPDATAIAATTGLAAATSPVLFVSAPVVGSMIVLGYGAVIGRTSGAIRGLRLSRDLLAGLVKDVLKAGYYVVILHAANNRAQRHAEAVINATLPVQTAYT